MVPRGFLCVNDEELFNLHDDFRNVVIMERLMEAVEDDLIRTDAGFAEYMRLASTDPGNEKVQSKGRNYKAARRYEWWQQRYREAKVDINVDRFKEAWKEPFE